MNIIVSETWDKLMDRVSLELAVAQSMLREVARNELEFKKIEAWLASRNYEPRYVGQKCVYMKRSGNGGDLR